ncbi:MAG: hypothetical protein SPJ13_08310, partial [Bacteroidales bacterium]|nr:hypothetical protein [Bacteroidales bacterium]
MRGITPFRRRYASTQAALISHLSPAAVGDKWEMSAAWAVGCHCHAAPCEPVVASLHPDWDFFPHGAQYSITFR